MRLIQFFFIYLGACGLLVYGGITGFSEYHKAKKFLDEGAVQKALPLLDTVVYAEKHSPQKALQTYGVEFGWFWYQKGKCESALLDWSSAKASYKTCYKNFATRRKTHCYYNTYALFRWAEACYQLHEYEEAYGLLQEFERVVKAKPLPKSDYSRGKLSVYLALATLKNGALEEGYIYTDRVMHEAQSARIPMVEVFKVFDAVIEAGIAAQRTDLLLKVIKVHRSVLESDIFALCGATKLLLSRVAELLERQETTGAYEVLKLIPCSQTVLNDLYSYRKKISKFGDYTSNDKLFSGLSLKRTESLIRRLEGDLRSRDSNEAIKLGLCAKIWNQYKHYNMAYQCYSLLTQDHAESREREYHLYQLVLLSQKLEKLDNLASALKGFINEFPESEYLKDSVCLTVETLYKNERYAEVISLIDHVKATIQVGEELKPMLFYVLGASYYYTEAYKTSLHFLLQYQMNASDRERGAEVRFMMSSNFLRLEKYQEAQHEIKEFYELINDETLTNRETVAADLIPYVLLNQLLIAYEGEHYEKVGEFFESLEAQEVPTDVLSTACNIMGQSYTQIGEVQQAETLYKRALQTSIRVKNVGQEARALINLIQLGASTLESSPGMGRRAKRYFDQYWSRFAGCQESMGVVKDGYKILVNNGKKRVGLQRLLEMLTNQAPDDELTFFYCLEYEKKNGIVSLARHLKELLDTQVQDVTKRVLFQMGYIKAYKKYIAKSHQRATDRLLLYKNETVLEFLNELARFKDYRSLPSIALIQLGHYTLHQTSTQVESLKYFEEVKQRGEKQFAHQALLGIAELYAKSENQEDRLACESLLREVYNDELSPEREQALYQMIGFLLECQRWSEASIKAATYLSHSNYHLYMKEVQVFYGVSLEKQNKTEEAIKAYTKCRSFSALATLQLMQILWRRDLAQTTLEAFEGKGGDRMVSILIAREYLQKVSLGSDEVTQIQNLLTRYQEQLFEE